MVFEPIHRVCGLGCKLMFDCDALLELGQDLASSPVADMTDAELMDAAVAAEKFESWFSLTRAHLLDELEKRGSCYEQHGLKTRYWVAQEANTSSGTVGAQIRFGRTLRERLHVID